MNGEENKTQELVSREPTIFDRLILGMRREDGSIDLEEMRQLMAMKRENDAVEAKKKYDTAIADFHAENFVIKKTKKVGYDTKDGDSVGYSHADLAVVTRTVSPLLAKHGLSFRWTTEQRDARIFVECVLSHAAGHSEKVSLNGAPDASGKKNAIQQVGSTITYLQRYTLMALLGLSAESDDDDGNKAETPVTEEQRAAQETIDNLLGKISVSDRYSEVMKLKSEIESLPATNKAEADKKRLVAKAFNEKKKELKTGTSTDVDA